MVLSTLNCVFKNFCKIMMSEIYLQFPVVVGAIQCCVYVAQSHKLFAILLILELFIANSCLVCEINKVWITNWAGNAQRQKLWQLLACIMIVDGEVYFILSSVRIYVCVKLWFSLYLSLINNIIVNVLNILPFLYYICCREILIWCLWIL